MKTQIILLLCLFSISLNAVITDDLWQEIQNKGENELIPVNIILSENYVLSSDPYLKTDLSKKERNEYVVQTLQSFAEESQRDILDELEMKAKEKKVEEITPLWISNVISCHATSEVILQLAEKNSITVIDWDEERKMLLDTRVEKEQTEKDREITWNVSLINATDVWDLGFTGEGVLVAVIDTGINYNHVDLADHLWSHDDYPNHGYNFYANTANPMDDNGHGTHCAGTVAGDGTAGSQTGVAPDATIMGLKVLGSDGNGSESNVWQAIQFAITHEVDVISMSLGWMHSWNPQRATWRNTMNNALAANLVAAVAAGNSGDQQYYYPIPDNVATPGDCPPPWFHPDQTLTSSNSAVICVGSTTSSDYISGFSSRGPITWQNVGGYNDYAYQPGMGLIRPDIVAPGSNIKSLAHYSNYGYESGWNGTSMATPAVAGTIALMLSKNPYLTPAEISQILEENTLPLSTTKSNTYGSGRVDALAAVNATFSPDIPPSQVINPIPEHNATSVSPSSLVLQWEMGSGAEPEFYQISIGTDNPPTNLILDSIIMENFFETSQLFENGETYYWKVDSYNSFGSSEGDVWSFTTLGLADEDFETGDFTLFPWQHSGQSDWQITSDSAASGIYSIKSGEVNSYENSSISVAINVVEAGNLVFWKKVSSQENDDKLRFYINNFIQDEWSGELDWSSEEYFLEEGYYELMWRYQKFDYVTEGEDCAWVDYIIFPEIGDLNPPILEIDVTEISQEIEIDNVCSVPFNLSNVGGGTIEYSLAVSYLADETGWIGLSAASGNLEEGECDEILVSFYSNGLDVGCYEASLIVNSSIGEPVEIPILLTVTGTSSDVTNLPVISTLQGNYPNPFNPQTTIDFAIANAEQVEINIYNNKGQLVRSLVNEMKQPGNYSVTWNGLDRKNQPVVSGIYLYQLKTKTINQIKKMILLK